MAATADVPYLTAGIIQRNTILRGIDASITSRVLREGSIVRLAVRQQRYRPEQLINEVYFPLKSVVSIVSRMKDGQQIEIGKIGREGMSGFPLLFGASSTANDCIARCLARLSSYPQISSAS